MLILADENIPGLRSYFGNLGTIRSMRGADMTSSDLRGIDVLLVRSATRVDEDLLDNNKPKFVATATAGTDHIDIELLNKSGIEFYNAPGSNAVSVVEYVLASLSLLAQRYAKDLSQLKFGIVGAGHVGSRLAKRLVELGAKVVISDPPLEERGIAAPDGTQGYLPYNELLSVCDVVSFHVPLSRGGIHPTFHMLDTEAATRLKSDAWVINAARGSVVSTDAALNLVARGNKLVLDVWEEEPVPSSELVQAVEVATPHIAGYAIDGKLRGTFMVRNSIADSLSASGDLGEWSLPEDLSAITGPPCEVDVENVPDPLGWPFMRQLYPIDTEHDAFVTEYSSASIDQKAEVFTLQRKRYPIRREFDTWKVVGHENLGASQKQILRGVLGMCLDD